MEYVKVKEISPLVGKGMCKVCYVGQDANRNGTVITKELATEMGSKLPGSPVVGFFDEEDRDFKGHEREIIVKNGKFEVLDITRPYGFVPTDANVWFEKYDDEGTIHEYLCCDVYIWTGVYPESQRILDRGNNQSMEIREISGFWTNDDKTNARIFIYNEALIEKLCILGENVEPCFEGASITKPENQFSYSEFQELKNQVFSILSKLQDTQSEGGTQETMEEITNPTLEETQEEIVETPVEEEVVTEPAAEPVVEVTEPAPIEETPATEEPVPAAEEPVAPTAAITYALDDIPEYVDLLNRYNALVVERDTLQTQNSDLTAQVSELKQFKLAAERVEKQNMIDSFYMLNDEDKADVIKNIDTYSKDEIEAKLSIICVRQKVSFGEQTTAPTHTGLFELQSEEEDNAPAWIKAVRNFTKNN